MDATYLSYKLGQFNMASEMLRQTLRQIEATQSEEFSIVFQLIDDLCEKSELEP